MATEGQQLKDVEINTRRIIDQQFCLEKTQNNQINDGCDVWDYIKNIYHKL